MISQGSTGFAPVYMVNPQVKEMMKQMQEVRQRVGETFYNNLFQVISQFETRSNVTATEIDARRAEAMLMLGPVLERLNHEAFAKIHDRVFGIASRAGVLPPAPPETQGQHLHVEFSSMIEIAQNANKANSIIEIMNLASQFAGVDPTMIDNIDMDRSFEKIAALKVGEPDLIRSPAALAAIRQQRAQQQAQQAQAQQADIANKLSAGAKNLAGANLTGGGNLLTKLTGQA